MNKIEIVNKIQGVVSRINSEKIEYQFVNVFIKFGYGIVSFIVGLSAFFVFKLIAMILMILTILITTRPTPENLTLMKGIDVLFFFLTAYLAIKYTKKLNKSGVRKSRIIKRIATVIVGCISAIAIIVVVIPVLLKI
jgi:hypothetical protein